MSRLGRGAAAFAVRTSAIVNLVLDGVCRINEKLSWIGVGCLIAIIFSVNVDVIGRFLFQKGFGLAFELSMSAMVIMVWVASASALQRAKHIEISILTDQLSARMRARFKVVTYGVGALVCALFTKIAWILFERSLATGEVTIVSKIPLFFLQGFIVIGFVLLALQFVALARDAWHQK